MEEFYFMIRSKPLLALALFVAALISIAGDGPPPVTEVPPPPPSCAGPPDPRGLIGTDWTDSDKAGWMRDQEAALQRCRDSRAASAKRGASWPR
jgi:hypothetical protein